MCESTVWLRYPDGRTEKIADNILIVKQEGANVVLRGLLAEPLRLTGTIQEIDSLKHIVTLLVTEPLAAAFQNSPAEITEPAKALSQVKEGPPDLSAAHLPER